MSTFKKVVLGLMAFWPLGYMVGFAAFMISMVQNQNMQQLNDIFPALFAVHFLTIMMCFGQMFYYIFHIMKHNQQLNDTNKIIWVLLLMFMNMLAVPAYWFMYIVRDHAAPRPVGYAPRM